MNYGGVVYCMLTCILYRLGLLRNLFYRFQTVGTMVYKDSDNTWPHRKTSIRNHFYFFLEYILTSSLLPVGDLLAPVTSITEGHQMTIGYRLLGYVYFLIFEWVYYGHMFAGFTGRKLIGLRSARVLYFIKIAEQEMQDVTGKERDNTETHWQKKQEELVHFYA